MECPICYEPMTSDKYITVCNHSFHKNCMKKIHLCPLCRMSLHKISEHVIYHKKYNIESGTKWTVGVDNRGVVISSFPIWIS